PTDPPSYRARRLGGGERDSDGPAEPGLRPSTFLLKVLVVGSGAREHALTWKCMQSPLTDRVYVAPGNGGTGGMGRNVPIQADDVPALVRFAKKEKLDL